MKNDNLLLHAMIFGEFEVKQGAKESLASNQHNRYTREKHLMRGGSTRCAKTVKELQREKEDGSDP